MADLDAEFARFAAELKNVEEATATAASAAPPPVLSPPVAAQANHASAEVAVAPAAVAPPPLVPPPLRPPPVLLPPAAAAAAPAGVAGYAAQPAAVGYQQQLQQQYDQYMAAAAPVQAVAGYQQPAMHTMPHPAAPYSQQPMSYQQPAGYQQPPPPAAATAAGGWGTGVAAPGAGMPGMGYQQQQQQQQHTQAAGSAPADPETLKRLKQELLQQKQQDGKTGKGGSSDANKKAIRREAAGKRWVDPSLAEWPENDFRIFVGDLGNEVNDESLAKAFQRYPSFAKAKVIRDKRTNKSKGFGIVSILDGNDFAKALKEMNGKYIGNRPCKLSKSTWQERSLKKGGGGGGGGSGNNKRKGAPASAAQNGATKVPKLGPKAKYHVPILRNP